MSHWFSLIKDVYGDESDVKPSKKNKKDPHCNLYKQSQIGEHDEDFMSMYDDDTLFKPASKSVPNRYRKYSSAPVRTKNKYVDYCDIQKIEPKPSRRKVSCDDIPASKPSFKNDVVAGYDDEKYFPYEKFFDNDIQASYNEKAQYCHEESAHHNTISSNEGQHIPYINEEDDANTDIHVQQEFQEVDNRGHRHHMVNEQEELERDNVPNTTYKQRPSRVHVDQDEVVDFVEQFHNNKGRLHKQKKTTEMWIDLFLYVFSGVILIFALEQILQLGMKLALIT